MTKSRRRWVLLVFLALVITLLCLNVQSNHQANHISSPKDISSYSAYTTKDIQPSSDDLAAPAPISSPSNITRALIIASVSADDTEWRHDPLLDGTSKFLYVADDITARYHPTINKGHEVLMYLTYIIDHYDSLPDVSVFVHAHRFAWHNNDVLNNDVLEMVGRLSGERVLREGYVNLRCQWLPGCPAWMTPGGGRDAFEEATMRRVWAELWPGKPVPEVLAQPCCGQFAVSRARIHVLAVGRYEEFRRWVVETELNDSVSGRMWEYLWQVVFTGGAVVCPDQRVCYCDGFGVCFDDGAAFEGWFDTRNRRREVERELRKGREDGGVGKEEETKLEEKVRELNEELDARRLKALERGTDPRVRASVAGRTWSGGDGF